VQSFQYEISLSIGWDGVCRFVSRIEAALMVIDALRIAKGTKLAPLRTLPTNDERRRLDDWEKCSRQGLSLLIIPVKPSVHQSLNIAKTLE
jgi:hypothetical protein